MAFEADQASPVTQQRLRLAEAGFSPLPVQGKRPPMEEWQTKFNISRDEIVLWEKSWPSCQSTGILTKLTPALDIDITHPEAADAIEQLAREFFEEHGKILVRFGNAPKRAIPLRTDEPFGKLSRVFTAPNGSEQKIEILAGGQQLVVSGIHQDTKRPYTWHGGALDEISREDLPYVREAEMRGFLDAAAALLIKDFGFKDKGGDKPQAKTNGADQDHADPLDWGILISRILAGENLHDSIRDLAASLVAYGLPNKAAIEKLQGFMTASTVEKDARWRARYAEIPRAVRSARQKFEQEANTGTEQRPGSTGQNPLVEDARPPAFSDEALALRFAEIHGGDLRNVAAWNRWLSWNGGRWRSDDTLSAYNLARKVCRSAAAQCNKKSKATALASGKTVAAVERLARTDRRLAATATQWDANGWFLNAGDNDDASGDV